MPETEVGNPVASCGNAPPAEKKKEEEKHFIKFKLTDDKGNALQNIVLNVTLPDGSSEEKVSDDQ